MEEEKKNEKAKEKAEENLNTQQPTEEKLLSILQIFFHYWKQRIERKCK